ncbi:MAG: ATP-binding cassette domain-containing protein, partial [Nitrospira sp.]|nr:ATP-binding cassette domain-containing protein [Nitrospira sp.]
MKPLLEVKNLNYSYSKVPALKNITLTVREGETTAIIGANGAGKTTLLHTIVGLLTPSEGKILFQEKP